MKIKELIEQLQKLNPESNIWVLYDTFEPQQPEFGTATRKMIDDNKEIQPGDYVHET